MAAYRAAAAIEKRVREEIGDEAMEQFFRVLDVVADGEPVQPEDRHVPPGPAQPLRVWLQEQEDGNPGSGMTLRLAACRLFPFIQTGVEDGPAISPYPAR